MGSGKEYGVSHINGYVNYTKRKKVKYSTHLMVNTNRGHSLSHSETYEPNLCVEVM